jgi:hypothetical protein
VFTGRTSGRRSHRSRRRGHHAAGPLGAHSRQRNPDYSRRVEEIHFERFAHRFDPGLRDRADQGLGRIVGERADGSILVGNPLKCSAHRLPDRILVGHVGRESLDALIGQFSSALRCFRWSRTPADLPDVGVAMLRGRRRTKERPGRGTGR